MNQLMKYSILLASVSLVIAGCSPTEEAAVATGKVKLSFIATDSLASAPVSDSLSAPKAPNFAPSLAADVAAPAWVANASISTLSVTSGKPDEMSIAFTKLQLAQRGGANPLDILTDTAGKEVAITSSKVDISNLFQNTLETLVTCFDASAAEVGCKNEDGSPNTDISYAEYEIQTGEYTQLRASMLEAVKIKGCITQEYNGSSVTGVHTYCTQTNKNMFDSYGQNVDYENKVAETTTVSAIGFEEPEGSDMLADYTIPGGITIASGEKSELTLLIDTNRVMRFYNQANGAIDGGISANVSDKSFFYGTQLDKDMFIFVGKPGKIEGYSYYSRECRSQNGAPIDIPTDRLCDETQSNFSGYLKGWITIVYDAANEPLMVNIKSDYNSGMVRGNNQKLNAEDVYFDKNSFGTDTNNNVTSVSVDYGVPDPMVLKIESFENLAVGQGFLSTFTSDSTAVSQGVGWGDIYIKKEF